MSDKQKVLDALDDSIKTELLNDYQQQEKKVLHDTKEDTETTLNLILGLISNLDEDNLFNTDNFKMIFDLKSQVDKQQAIAAYREKAKAYRKTGAFNDLIKAYQNENRRKNIVAINHDSPLWFSEGKINEVVFCKKFTESNDLKCINTLFYSADGLIDEDRIKNKIQWLISPYVSTQLSKRTESLVKALKNYCYHEIPPLNESEIYLKNGTLKLDGAFIEENKFVLNRLNASYTSNYTKPERWCKFLNELLHEEDIQTLKEYLGYCLIPTTRAQIMLFLIGNGGEGKSQIGTVLKEIFGEWCESGSLADLENDKHALESLENKLLFIDDDLSTDGLKDTKNIKRIVTANGKILINPKYQKARDILIYSRLLAFGNTTLKSLYDFSDGFFRRQIVIRVKPKPLDREDDHNLIDKLMAELDQIFMWMFEGLQDLIMSGYHFTVSEKTRQNMVEMREEACNIIPFLEDEDYVEYGTDFQIASRDIYPLYCVWCEANGEKPLAQKTVSNYLKSNDEKLNIRYGRIYTRYGRVRGFIGLKGNQESDRISELLYKTI